MRRFAPLLCLLSLFLSSPAFSSPGRAPGFDGSPLSAELGNKQPAKIEPRIRSDNARDARAGGESWDDALVIQSIPFVDTGATCDNADDITFDRFASAPDVVYRYAPVSTVSVRISLDGSRYDTVLGIFDSDRVLLESSDDYGSSESTVAHTTLEAGREYFIVIDGFQSCGGYSITIEETPPCLVDCPPGALIEGEPPCRDEYYDDFNAGCKGGWSTLMPQSGNCGVLCGRSCTFLYQGFSYRDTDWYAAVADADGGPVTITCTAEFPLQLILIYGTDCNNLIYDLTTAAACEPATLTRDIGPDEELWVWVGPSVFNGVPESDYTLEICGIRVPGACCFSSGGCHVGSPELCERYDGHFLGWGTDCDPDPCLADPAGACCLIDGSCEVMLQSGCADLQGRFQGAGTNCEPDPCGIVPVQQRSWGRIKAAYR